MKKAILLSLIINIFLFAAARSQQKKAYQPVIEPCACPVKIDSSFKTTCAYLVVPENRKKQNGKTVKLPFIIVESKNPDKRKDPVLFTGGGPGSGSLGWARGAANSMIINDRDCIAFEQRGAGYSIPSLSGPELGAAVKESYKYNLNKDSMVVEGVKRLRKGLEARGIDLAGYNTDETVSDIHDLLSVLRIDSVNLFGISYSGGLMQAVLQRDPSRIRSLILDSPLPTFVPIDEDEPANFNEALNILFEHCKKDSADQALYGDLKEKFTAYFTAIGQKPFYISYLEKGATDSIRVAYNRNDLFDIIQNYFGKEAPYVITELIKGNHREYVTKLLDYTFSGHRGPSGMRITVYCADQAIYHDEHILRQINNAYPYMEGYHINDVYNAMCDCWNYTPVKAGTKQPFYSAKPAFLADGEMDNACRPLYIDMIHHYMPNSQRLLFINKYHGVIGRDVQPYLVRFLNNPYQQLISDRNDIIFY
ncbi:alpha/beta fold hydrolase [Chitinophaga sp. S165]|uniref:alpha/beta fold hydrolase n=1 Tax=Chitinophaga sp. S165 TaxID=2135462 RepID=UPI000D713292|nr:alpha/beta hydrolase [Chitinophaga sp. S165]PWV56865.1 pimeloyl-ACP methyl ester carboxylesterase [Chitinophaga sp. S165]